jgi:L-ascorbate metabolism protein UlaG (beta-lactamase superfamily)
MRLTWVGHSCFLVEPEVGPRVLHDPYATPGCGDYDPVDVEADVVTVSHSYDARWHGDLTHVGGDPTVLEDLFGADAKAEGVGFRSVETYHAPGDTSRPNTSLRYEVDDVVLAHLGDLGHTMDEDQRDALRPADVVMAPASGVYVIEPEDLVPELEALDSSVVVPMHVGNDRIDLGMRPVDDLLGIVDRETEWAVDRVGRPERSFEAGDLGDGTEVWVFEPLR